MGLLIYLGILLTALIILSFVIIKFKPKPWVYSILAAFYALAFLWTSFNFGRNIFEAMSFACIGVFVGATYLLILSAVVNWPKYKIVSGFFGVFAIVLILIAVDAFFIEPHWLEVTRMKIVQEDVPKKVKVVILSDIQTDRVGQFEEYVLKQVMKEKPDMIMLPGDFVQPFYEDLDNQKKKLNKLLKKVGLAAPLGIYATQGDCESSYSDYVKWDDIFEGLPVTCFTESSTVSNEYFAITGLTLKDSFELTYAAPDTELFHIWIGHRPGYALNRLKGQLLIAGHTHGGQVQIPFYGPVFTFSKVPRIWGAGGLRELSPGKNLIISRGIGMERGLAPRIRFLCRPQLIVLELVPEKDS